MLSGALHTRYTCQEQRRRPRRAITVGVRTEFCHEVKKGRTPFFHLNEAAQQERRAAKKKTAGSSSRNVEPGSIYASLCSGQENHSSQICAHGHIFPVLLVEHNK